MENQEVVKSTLEAGKLLLLSFSLSLKCKKVAFGEFVSLHVFKKSNKVYAIDLII